jgi:alkyl hydroperoxide reductase subunit F
MYDLVVVGGGPAGLTATIYGIRKRLDVLLVSKDLGGKTNYQLHLPFIHEYQLVRGVETVDKFRRELEYLEFARLMDGVTRVAKADDGFTLETGEGQVLSARAVIVATGTQGQRLNIPGEREFMMRGVCYSVMSYSQFFIDRTVAVVGDGELALRGAAELATVAAHVYMVGAIHAVLDTPLGRKLTEAEHVTLLDGYRPTEVLGAQFAEGLKVRGPQGQEQVLQTDGIFIEQALLPRSELVADLVELDPQGRIKVDARCCTSVSGIYAAGDVTGVYSEQTLVAMGEGAKAALSAYEYLLPRLASMGRAHDGDGRPTSTTGAKQDLGVVPAS